MELVTPLCKSGFLSSEPQVIFKLGAPNKRAKFKLFRLHNQSADCVKIKVFFANEFGVLIPLVPINYDLEAGGTIFPFEKDDIGLSEVNAGSAIHVSANVSNEVSYLLTGDDILVI